jgi:protein TonB
MSLEPLNAEGATRRIWPALLRWAVAALVVVSAHGSLAWFALSWRPNEAAAGAPEPAVMIELAAVSVAPEAPPEELPPAPQPAQTDPEPPPPEPIKDPEPPPPEPEPEPEPVQQPEPEIKLPELPQLPDAAAVLAPPPPPKPEEKPKVEPKPKPRVVERRKPVEREKPRAREAAAPPPLPTPAATPSSAPVGSTATPSVSTASWRGMLIAHLDRYKRFPPGARTGTVQVAFSIDRGGRVLSARLTGSSGDTALDEEAVSMVRRASPVPAPPSGVGGGGAIALAVPVRFNR